MNRIIEEILTRMCFSPLGGETIPASTLETKVSVDDAMVSDLTMTTTTVTTSDVSPVSSEGMHVSQATLFNAVVRRQQGEGIYLKEITPGVPLRFHLLERAGCNDFIFIPTESPTLTTCIDVDKELLYEYHLIKGSWCYLDGSIKTLKSSVFMDFNHEGYCQDFSVMSPEWSLNDPRAWYFKELRERSIRHQQRRSMAQSLFQSMVAQVSADARQDIPDTLLPI